MMVMKTSAFLAGAFALLATASPIPDSLPDTNSTYDALTPETLITIAPETASCGDAPIPPECADAYRAAPAITNSFKKYGIETAGEQAALVALMLFESANFKYNKNHFPEPGTPGKGTRNMQSPEYNKQYATSIYGEQAVAVAETSGPDAVLAMVSADPESFGSAAWFLSSQCDANIRQGLAAGTHEGWLAYYSQCVGAPEDPTRDAPWEAALKAMNGGK